jgi:hypothetical protein
VILFRARLRREPAGRALAPLLLMLDSPPALVLTRQG